LKKKEEEGKTNWPDQRRRMEKKKEERPVAWDLRS